MTLSTTLKTVFPEIIHIKVTSKFKALNIKTIKQTWHVWSEMYKNTANFKGVNVLIYVSRVPQGFLVWSVVVEKPLKQASVYYSLPLHKRQ